MTAFTGTLGNDEQTGTADDDSFDYAQGGSDALNGEGGADTFTMGAAFDAGDAINGGGARDTVILDGDYDLILEASTMQGVRTLELAAGHAYAITTNDANIADGMKFVVSAKALATTESLVLDASAETNALLRVIGGDGGDILIAGGGFNRLNGHGGPDQLFATAGTNRLYGGGGADVLSSSIPFSSSQLYGGRGSDNMSAFGNGLNYLNGDAGDDYLDGHNALGSGIYWGGDGNDTIACTTSQNAGGGAGDDRIDVYAGGNSGNLDGDEGDDTYYTHGVALAFSFDGGSGIDTLVARADITVEYSPFDTAGSRLEVLDLDGMTFQGGANGNGMNFSQFVLAGPEQFVRVHGNDGDDYIVATGGNDHLGGGADNDQLMGLAGDDFLKGGKGSDTLDGGSGADTFLYGAASQSTSINYDKVKSFDAIDNRFDFEFAVTGVDNTISSGTLSNATFDFDVAAAVDGAHLAAGHAVLFVPDAGQHAGTIFLIVDANGASGYQASEDFVIALQAVNLDQFGVGNFI